MAPGTRPQQDRNAHQHFETNADDEFGNMMNNVQAPAVDPWQAANPEIIPAAAANAVDILEKFEDSFVPESESDVGYQIKYEGNKEYLAYLETKLHKIESHRKNVSKLSAREVLVSIRDVKETQLNWNMHQGEFLSEDDTIDSDSSGPSRYSLPKELKRKMFPEQDALNETELLHLLDYDTIGKLFSQLHNI